MSKESLTKLNEALIKHFKETGIKNAYYYEPVSDPQHQHYNSFYHIYYPHPINYS